jgi:hypothetical protein
MSERDKPMNAKPSSRIDPDPFTLAALMISGCSLVLQFVQTFKSVEQAPPSNPSSSAQITELLDYLRHSVEDFRSKIDRTKRLIERGSNDSDTEFYEARFRLDQGALFLDPASYDQFRTALSEAFAAAGTLALWINHIQLRNQSLSFRIGQHLSEPLAGMSARLNAIIAEGRANRGILEDLYFAMTSLLDAIDAEERGLN